MARHNIMDYVNSLKNRAELTIKEESPDPVLWENYRKWLLKKAFFPYDNYELLTGWLHSTDYTYVIEKDPDRLATGFTTLWDKPGSLDIRTEFNNLSDSTIKFPDYYKIFLIKDQEKMVSCSVLEELVRRAFANEEYYMCEWVSDDDPRAVLYKSLGGRTYRTAIRIDRGPHLFEFFLMNLGLMKFDDSNFNGNEELVDFILKRWMNREYDHDGNGGIMPNPGSDRDQRVIPMSSQIGEHCMHYIDGYCWLTTERH